MEKMHIYGEVAGIGVGGKGYKVRKRSGENLGGAGLQQPETEGDFPQL